MIDDVAERRLRQWRRPREWKTFTEEQRWETFARGVVELLDGSQEQADALAERLRRDVEARPVYLTFVLDVLFPRMAMEQREQFVKLVHVLES